MTIEFGILVPPLKEQVGFDSKIIQLYQKRADAVNILGVCGYLTRSQVEKTEKRLMKDIEKEVRAHRQEAQRKEEAKCAR